MVHINNKNKEEQVKKVEIYLKDQEEEFKT